MYKSMNAPKILPWIAARAAISDELALKLWRRAVSETAYLTGKSSGSEYWGLTVERFISLVEDESGGNLSRNLAQTPRLSWMWRHQTRMSLLSLVAAQNTYRFWQDTWGNLRTPKKAA